MSIYNKRFDSIDKSDLDELISSKVFEGKTIDYKLTLPGGNDADRKEFLYDVSSFANASGGHLIFGIKEDKGEAIAMPGIKGVDPDAIKGRLESMIRSGISPRIPGVGIAAVLVAPDTFIFVINIPRSWAQPHMVTFQDASRFYSRSSFGKCLLSVDEIRAQFSLSETTADRIRSFRIERLGKIVSDETPIPLGKNAKIVLHIVPLVSFDIAARYDVSTIHPSLVQPIYGGYGNRVNFDGFLSYHTSNGDKDRVSYVQIFRNGIIEAVDTCLLSSSKSDRKLIPSEAYESYIMKAIPKYFEIYELLQITPPVIIMLSMIEVRDYQMAVSSRYFSSDQYPIEKDELIIPEILVEEFKTHPGSFMKPAFEVVWNACGWPKSLNYTDSGEWVGQKS